MSEKIDGKSLVATFDRSYDVMDIIDDSIWIWTIKITKVIIVFDAFPMSSMIMYDRDKTIFRKKLHKLKVALFMFAHTMADDKDSCCLIWHK